MKAACCTIILAAAAFAARADGESRALRGSHGWPNWPSWRPSWWPHWGRPAFTLFSPDPNLLVWDDIVDGGDVGTTSLHGWLKVPMNHDNTIPSEDQPPHVCLRISAHTNCERPRNGPLLAHCGGPGSDRTCAYGAMQVLSEVADDFAWVGIDQRGVGLKPDVPSNRSDGSVAACPFKEENGDPVLQFPVVACDEISATLADLNLSEQVDHMREILVELMVGDDLSPTDEEMEIVFTILRSGLVPVDVERGAWYRNETYVRWYYRLVQLQFNLCVNAPRYMGRTASGRPYRTLSFAGTWELARDLDLLREAIGADKMSLLGQSYGTMVTPAYASLFPDRVDRLIVDGVISPQRDLLGTLDVFSQGFFSVLNGIMTDCALSVYQGSSEAERCPLAPSPSSKLMEMLNDESNLPRQAATASAAVEMSLNIGVAPLAMDCLASLHGNRTLAAYCNSDMPAGARPIARGDFGFALPIPVWATDIPGRLSEEAYTTWWRRSLEEFPIGTALTLAYAAGMGSYPLYSKPLPPAGSPTIQALIVGNLHDPQTDYHGAQLMRAAYPAGAIMTWQGYGHTLNAGRVPGTKEVQLENAESRARCFELVVNYLSTRNLPDDGHACTLSAPLNLGLGAVQLLQEPVDEL